MVSLGNWRNFGRGFSPKKDDIGDVHDPVTATEDGGGYMYEVIDPREVPNAPIGSIAGMVGPNMHMAAPNRGEEYDHTPITFNRIGTRWGDIQLKNGLANRVATGAIQGYRGEGWYDVAVPYLPGQTRQIGGPNPGNYAPKGGAPSQWQDAVNSGPGSQPMYPGGPGYLAAPELFNPGSGG